MLTCCGHPHLHRLVKTGRSQILPIRRPGERADPIRVSTIDSEALSGDGVPNLYGLIIAGRSQALAIRGPGHCTDGIEMRIVRRERGTHRRGATRDGESIRNSIEAQWDDKT